MKLIKAVAYAGFATLALVLVLELVARAIEFASPPNEGSQNAAAFNDPNAFRVFVYGGSTAEGRPYLSYGFASQLEFWLREIHPEKRLEIVNFAKAGRGSTYAVDKVEETISYDPDLLIVLSGHNEFLDRASLVNKVVDTFAISRLLFHQLNRVRKTITSKRNVMPVRRGYDRASPEFADVVSTYRDNMSRIVSIAQSNGTPLLLLTAPSNVAEWPPVHRKIAMADSEEQSEQQRDEWIARTHQLVDSGAADEAARYIGEQLQTFPNHPLLTYLLAKAEVATGNEIKARQLFHKAKDLDPIPWRALSQFNDDVRDLATRDGVFLVDVEQLFEAHSTDGLVGFPLIGDNCHPTPLGNSIIASELVAVMGQQQLFVEKVPVLSNPAAALDRFYASTSDAEKLRSVEMIYLVENAKYAMKTPFYNYNASRMYLDQALTLDASRWEVWVNLATLALLEDRIDEGRHQLQKAIELRGAPLDPLDRQNAPYLNEALLHSGVNLADFQTASLDVSFETPAGSR